MPVYSNAKYFTDSSRTAIVGISVTIDGMLWNVPLVIGNADYDNIMALVASGKLTILPPE